jgi:hypothetical protein
MWDQSEGLFDQPVTVQTPAYLSARNKGFLCLINTQIPKNGGHVTSKKEYSTTIDTLTP